MNVFSTIYRQLMRHKSSGRFGFNRRNSPWYSGEHSSVHLRQPRPGRGESGNRPVSLGRVTSASPFSFH